MRILVVTNMFPSDGDESWRGVFVKEQVDRLVQLYPNVHCDILHIKGAISKGGSNFNYVLGLYRYLRLQWRNPYDIVWAHHSFCVFLAAIYKKSPLVYTVHEGSFASGLKFALLKLAVKLSDCALFVNKAFFNLAHHSNKYFLPSGVDANKFSCLSHQECREQLGLMPKKFYILFPAAPERPEKNAAFARSFIQTHAAWLESENIEFLFGGKIDYKMMPVWMNAVDCMVSFSDFESDGMVFKEAMACNLPVISFDVGNAAIYFKDQLAGSIINKNHDELKEKISYWKNIGRSEGRKHLLTLGMDNYSVVRQLNTIFNEMADGNN